MSDFGSGLVPENQPNRHPLEFGITKGVLLINGSQKKDTITLSEISGNRLKVVAVLNGVRQVETHKLSAIRGIRVQALGGDDTINNLTGKSAVLVGGTGNDLIRGGRGMDTILAGAGNDVAFGGLGNDVLRGLDGDDTLDGGKGNDKLFGGNGNDKLLGKEGNDVLHGDAGNDTGSGDAGNDSLFGAAGDDVLRGGIGNDRVNGGDDDDLLVGDSGADILHGDAGDDTVESDSETSVDTSADRAFGDSGTDVVYGTYSLDLVRGGGQGTDRERTRYLVDNLSDTADNNFGAGQLTFRDAVGLANDDDIISFVKLTQTSARTLSVINGAYNIVDDISIESGSSAGRLTFSGLNNNWDRLFTIDSGAQVSIKSVTIRDFGNGTNNGGAIIVNDGGLSLESVTARTNTGNDGGFLYLATADSSAKIVLSNISQNTAAGFNGLGGGIANILGELVIDRSTLDSNTGMIGGGLYTNEDTWITGSTISNNIATNFAGGIGHDVGGSLSIVNSTISGNIAATLSAAIDSFALAANPLTITNCTIVFNQVQAAGGSGLALSNDGTGAPRARVNNTIVFGNTSNGVAADFGPWAGFGNGLDVANSFNNLVGNGANSGLTNGVKGNKVNVANAGIDTSLKNNGGPTKTHRLLTGSTAINAGSNAKAVDWLNVTLTVDQLQKTRKVGSAVDIGAFEVQA